MRTSLAIPNFSGLRSACAGRAGMTTSDQSCIVIEEMMEVLTDSDESRGIETWCFVSLCSNFGVGTAKDFPLLESAKGGAGASVRRLGAFDYERGR